MPDVKIGEQEKQKEPEKILKEVTEESNLSKEEVEAIENLVGVNGGKMSDGMKSTLIHLGTALAGAAFGSAATFGVAKACGYKFQKDS